MHACCQAVVGRSTVAHQIEVAALPLQQLSGSGPHLPTLATACWTALGTVGLLHAWRLASLHAAATPMRNNLLAPLRTPCALVVSRVQRKK
jgi:hypothetical protein